MNMSTLWVTSVWDRTINKTLTNASRIRDSFPHVSVEGKYDQTEPDWWTAGFWPGLLWLVYRDHPQSELLTILNSCEHQLESCLHNIERVDHDLGFIWLLSGVINYRLTGNIDSRRRGLLAANLLAARYNIEGQFIRAWNFESSMMDTRNVAIIDSMMNLPLLYWASEETGDPRYAYIAASHANTIAREFVRDDGSIAHVMEFFPKDNLPPIEHGGQGYAPGSGWARGTSWAIYGFSLSYEQTQDPQHLSIAEGAADFFLAQLGEDIVPYWDFRAPVEHQIAWDSSASAIAASGLLELAKYSSRAQHYTNAAETILRGLSEHYTSWDNPEAEEAIIIQGTVHYPEQRYLNTPIIYGDYFFTEALSKLRGDEGFFSKYETKERPRSTE